MDAELTTEAAGELHHESPSDRYARLTMWAMWPISLVIIFIFGRHQWFIADDWAFLLERARMKSVGGLDAMLFTPQDGHWMMWPIIVFRAVPAMFGLGSYLPYLAVVWACHLGVVALVRAWMTRFGVSPWTNTLMATLLLLFGAGWENVFFAVQIVYLFSLLAFLAHMLLVDHDGPIDWRDWTGAAISLIGVSSSGFGPFFAFGVGLLLVLRKRWTAAVLAVAPQALVWLWWWAAWGDDPVGDSGQGGPSFVAHFVETGLTETLGSMLGLISLGGAGLVLCLAIAAWPKTSPAVRAPVIALLATATVMYAGIGYQREAFGVGAAIWSRYQYVAAMLVAPVLALGLDQARRFAPWGVWVVRVLLLFAITRNVMWMSQRSDYWAGVSGSDRQLFELVAGSPRLSEAEPNRPISMSSPDVRVGDIEQLVSDGAIVPVQPVTPEQQAQVAAALGLP